jgi:hypothetical protein
MKDVEAWPRFARPGHLLELQVDKHLAELVRSWNFQPGIDFQDHIFDKFRCSVHHPSSSQKCAFHLLVVFCCYKFRLTPSSASFALHACLGGTSVGFHVEPVKDRYFRISVANKAVGLDICALRRIVSTHYDIYFHLWRDGGECWERELVRWQEEEENNWTKVVSRKKRGPSAKRVSFSKQIVQDSPVKKFKPQELNDVIKIGTFFCPLEPTPSPRKTNKVLKFNFLPLVDIPVKEVFGRIHGNLQKIQAHPRHNRVPRSENRIGGSGANLACSRCLAPGHNVRDCRGHL